MVKVSIFCDFCMLFLSLITLSRRKEDDKLVKTMLDSSDRTLWVYVQKFVKNYVVAFRNLLFILLFAERMKKLWFLCCCCFYEISCSSCCLRGKGKYFDYSVHSPCYCFYEISCCLCREVKDFDYSVYSPC